MEDIIMSITTMATLKTKSDLPVIAGFDSAQGFELLQRISTVFSKSKFVPQEYQGEIGMPNCIIAVNIAIQANTNPLTIMQNLYVVNGRPSWSSQWIISGINRSGKFSSIKYRIKSLGEKEVIYTYKLKDGSLKTDKFKINNVECVAYATELSTNEILESPAVSIEMAVNEGWYSKSGSKWKTMPELMLRYRSASFFGRLYCPEIFHGLPSEDESRDIITIDNEGNISQETVTLDKKKVKNVTPVESPTPATATQEPIANEAEIIDDEIDPALVAAAEDFFGGKNNV